MGKIKVKCHICGYINKSETPPDVCEKCGTNLVYPEDEKLIKTSFCSSFVGKSHAGALYLTNKRLIWLDQNQTGYIAGAVAGGLVGGLIGKAIDNKSNAGKGFVIFLPQLESVHVKKVKLSTNVFLQTKDGVQIQLAPAKLKEWVSELENVISFYNK